MKKILSIFLSMIMLCTMSTTVLASDTSQSQSSEDIGVTIIKQELEKQEIPNTGSTTYEIEMEQDGSENQDRAIANERVSVMVVGNQVLADVFLSGIGGVYFTKMEGTARLYVNGSYKGSEDFEANPLIPVSSLQAGTVFSPDGLKKGDSVTVYFDGSYDTKNHGSSNIYGSASAEA